MTRTKEFDQNDALQGAIRAFSRHGFAAMPLDTLLGEMGIGRQSMYDTFGDKRTLFLKALKQYGAQSVDLILAELQKPGDPIEVLRHTLIAFSERDDLASADGCMGLNALSEFGVEDAEVTLILHEAGTRLGDQIIKLLKKAAQQGSLPRNQIATAADFMNASFAGIRYAAKAGSDRKSLRRLAEFAGNALTFWKK